VLKNVTFDFEYKEVVHKTKDEDDDDGDDDSAVIYIDTDTYFICARCEARKICRRRRKNRSLH
jgi:hypothetical protein